MSGTANTGYFKSHHEMLKHKINFDYLVFVKFFKLDDTHYLKVRKFMQNCTKSQLPGTFNNYFELITVVHPYDARQI